LRQFRLACLSYVSLALPGSTLGLLWPPMSRSTHEPLAALGIFIVFGTAASVLAGLATGPLLGRLGVGPVLAGGAALVATALGAESVAPSFVVLVCGSVLFSTGFGAADTAVNAYAAGHLGPRDTNWLHASYGLGATLGPLVVTALLGQGLGWRWAMACLAGAQGALSLYLLARVAWWAAAPGAAPSRPTVTSAPASERSPGPAGTAKRRAGRGGPGWRRPGWRRPGWRRQGWGPLAVLVATLVFCALETGAESAAGIWGFVYLSAGEHLGPTAAGAAVSAYWATMFVGRVVMGPVAERTGAAPAMGLATAGVVGGALVVTLAGGPAPAVVGLALVGLAAAPIFPLVNTTTARRFGAGAAVGPTRAVTLQVGASTLGGAVVPALAGLAIGGGHPGALGPVLLVTSTAMALALALMSPPGRPALPAG
jgi:fucose permease